MVLLCVLCEPACLGSFSCFMSSFCCYSEKYCQTQKSWRQATTVVTIFLRVPLCVLAFKNCKLYNDTSMPDHRRFLILKMTGLECMI